MFYKKSDRTYRSTTSLTPMRDLKCPRCGHTLFVDFYATYRAAPWAAMRGHRRCSCGYRLSL